jgi:hypothetical protein
MQSLAALYLGKNKNVGLLRVVGLEEFQSSSVLIRELFMERDVKVIAIFFENLCIEMSQDYDELVKNKKFFDVSQIIYNKIEQFTAGQRFAFFSALSESFFRDIIFDVHFTKQYYDEFIPFKKHFAENDRIYFFDQCADKDIFNVLKYFSSGREESYGRFFYSFIEQCLKYNGFVEIQNPLGTQRGYLRPIYVFTKIFQNWEYLLDPDSEDARWYMEAKKLVTLHSF